MALFDDTFGPYVPFGSRVLRLQQPHLRGTDVAVLQSMYDLMLATMRPARGPIGRLVAISGVFTEETERAIRSVQSHFGLRADGVAGPRTYLAFGQAPGGQGPAFGRRPLGPGDRGDDVLVLQNRLNVFHYAQDIGHPADGAFDAGTEAAVLRLKADAVAQGDTGFPDNAVAGPGFYDATRIYTFTGGRPLNGGCRGFDVAFLQALLAHLGYFRGHLSGFYGPGTRDAVVAFQRAQGLRTDGVVGPQTLYALGLQNAAPGPHPLAAPWPVRARLDPVPTSPVRGAAQLYFTGPRAVRVSLSAGGLRPGSTYAAALHFGTCARGGPVAFPLGLLVPDSAGRARTVTALGGVAVIPPSGWFITVAPAAAPEEARGVVACGDVTHPFPLVSPDTADAASSARVTLDPQSGATAAGAATLRFTGPRTLQVTVTVSGLAAGSVHPGHIHFGSCAAVPEGPVAYPLGDLVADAGGRASGTTVLTPVEVVPPVGWYVDVHRGPTLADGGATPIACGDVNPPGPVLPLVGV